MFQGQLRRCIAFSHTPGFVVVVVFKLCGMVAIGPANAVLSGVLQCP